MKKNSLIMLLLVMSIMASKSVYSQIREQLVGTVISNEENNVANFLSCT